MSICRFYALITERSGVLSIQTQTVLQSVQQWEWRLLTAQNELKCPLIIKLSAGSGKGWQKQRAERQQPVWGRPAKLCSISCLDTLCSGDHCRCNEPNTLEQRCQQASRKDAAGATGAHGRKWRRCKLQKRKETTWKRQFCRPTSTVWGYIIKLA